MQGELITVKENSLLLLNSEGADISVDMKDIRVIKIVKKSNLLVGAGVGFLIVGVPGALYLTAYPGTDSQRWLYALGGASLGLYSAIIGGIIGAIAGKDKTIQIERKSDSEIKRILENLRKKARIPDYN